MTGQLPSDPLATPLPGDGPEPDSVPTKIVDAAIAEFTEYGIKRVGIDNIARRAGIHRVTVYRHFGGKDEIVAAAALAWVQRFLAGVSRAVVDAPTVEERFVDGFALSLWGLRAEPLVRRILDADPEYALPYLTTRGGATVAALRTSFAAQLRGFLDREDKGAIDVDGVAEFAVRLGLSFLLTPESHFELDGVDRVRAFARRYLAPLLR
ncbi:TetR/AcrR family transcriptional regulator [Nocardia huaxiensis]|uniref:TetR/AcrR family transcriptional regulator n=1 Tax=Nocardia huaxiensis TaxID=2755382 RepID=UPI001E4D81CE|nr:TetR/AcrR family transcriptional regulator [Nocardia huaxiensis]UFS98549.1 TetR/AcrR family transcriptional regulator [Nocardia huaxiensis]